MRTPLVSIIITVFNSEDFISDAINSALDQTYTNKEIIIVDDCSTDNSYKKAQSFESKNVKIFKLDKNSGQCLASNIGILKSSGDLIKFLDADDLLDEEYLSNALKEGYHDDYMYFSQCSSFQNTFNKNSLEPYEEYHVTDMEPIDFLLNPISNMRQGGRWLIPKKRIIESGYWDETLTLINDYEFFTRLCLGAEKIKFISTSIYYYRIALGTLSGQRSLQAFNSAFQSIIKGHTYLINVENSHRVNQYTANMLQAYVHTMYPEHSALRKLYVNQINLLGGSNKKFESSGITLIFSKILGWRTALWIRFIFIKKVLKR